MEKHHTFRLASRQAGLGGGGLDGGGGGGGSGGRISGEQGMGCV